MLKFNRIIILFCFFIFFPMISIAGSIPDTGQTKCYNNSKEIPCPQPGEAYFGQDAQYDGPARSYSRLGQNGVESTDENWIMVRDNVTGLYWEIKQEKDNIKNYADPHDADNRYYWYDPNPMSNGGDAGTPGDNRNDTHYFIKALNDSNFGGFNDWRIPTVKELASLIHADGKPPTIDEKFFPDISYKKYWSATTDIHSNKRAWTVDLYYGSCYTSSSYKESDLFAVRAVRGDASEVFKEAIHPDRLQDNQDGTVTDTETGLMWQQERGPGLYNWREALAYSESLSLAGHSDWRLPNFLELQTLVDYNAYDPATKFSIFPKIATDKVYFSSSTINRLASQAYCVDFKDGYSGEGSKDSYFYVRAVRNIASAVSTQSMISQNPSSGTPGTVFLREGEGFSPNRSATLYFKAPDNRTVTHNQPIDANGCFEFSEISPYLTTPGIWEWWGVDDLTGQSSNTMVFTIICPVSPILTDVNGDGQFGLEEIVYGLQILTGHAK